MPTVTTTYVIGNGNNGAGANQIASETTSGVTTAYGYDGNGNRTSKSTPVLTTTGNTSNSSTTISGLASTTGVAVGMAVSGTGIPVGSTVATMVSSTSITISMAATANGTGVSISFTNGVGSSYDYENRLIGLTYNVGGAAAGAYSYAYDYRTRRVSRTEPGPVTTYIVFDGGTSIEEYTSSPSSPTVEYVRGFNYGGGVGGLEYSIRSGTPSFNFFDSRGDVVAKTNSGGATTWETAYEAFGNQTASSGTTPADRQRASTKEQDPTGLLNEGFRYRDPSTGTFLTRDPLGFLAGLNNYTYVRQNPWTSFDPEGLDGTQPNPQTPPPTPTQLSVNESSKRPNPTPQKPPANSPQDAPAQGGSSPTASSSSPPVVSARNPDGKSDSSPNPYANMSPNKIFGDIFNNAPDPYLGAAGTGGAPAPATGGAPSTAGNPNAPGGSGPQIPSPPTPKGSSQSQNTNIAAGGAPNPLIINNPNPSSPIPATGARLGGAVNPGGGTKSTSGNVQGGISVSVDLGGGVIFSGSVTGGISGTIGGSNKTSIHGGVEITVPLPSPDH
jgi:RHS repeat-associated protein